MPILNYRKSLYKTGFEVELVTQVIGMKIAFCGTSCYIFSQTLFPEKWYFVSIIANDTDTTISLMLDGKLFNKMDYFNERSKWFLQPFKHANLLFGKDHDKFFFNGKISDVSIWQIPLSKESLIDQMHQQLSPENLKSKDLIGYWPLSEQPEEKVCYDFGPNQLDGTYHRLERITGRSKSIVIHSESYEFSSDTLLLIQISIIIFLSINVLFCIKFTQKLSRKTNGKEN
jgi:hypothetical protein